MSQFYQPKQSPEDIFYRSEIPPDESASLDISLEITSPNISGLYVENRPITIQTTIKNIGNEPVDIHAIETITKSMDPDFEETITFEQMNIHPNGQINHEASRILEAGTYRVLVFATTQDYRQQAGEILFVVSSHQDLLIRQQAEFARVQAESAADSANTARSSLFVALAGVIVGGAATGAAIVFTKRSADKHHNLTKESNELLRTELHERLRPILRIINSSTELRTSKDPHVVQVRCTLQNLGSVPARVVKYWYKTTQSKTIEELVQEWDELKSGEGQEIGSLLQNATQKLIFNIPWPTGLKRQNVALLLECVFLNNTYEETVVIMDVTGGLSEIPQLWYTQKDVDDAKRHKSNNAHP